MTRSRIVPALFLRQAHIAEAAEAVPERAERKGHVVFPGEDNDTREAEFQVPGWLEAELLSMDPRSIGIAMPLQRAKQTFIAKRPGHFGEYWNAQRHHTIDAQRIDRLGVVSE